MGPLPRAATAWRMSAASCPPLVPPGSAARRVVGTHRPRTLGCRSTVALTPGAAWPAGAPATCGALSGRPPPACVQRDVTRALQLREYEARISQFAGRVQTDSRGPQLKLEPRRGCRSACPWCCCDACGDPCCVAAASLIPPRLCARPQAARKTTCIAFTLFRTAQPCAARAPAQWQPLRTARRPCLPPGSATALQARARASRRSAWRRPPDRLQGNRLRQTSAQSKNGPRPPLPRRPQQRTRARPLRQAEPPPQRQARPQATCSARTAARSRPAARPTPTGEGTPQRGAAAEPQPRPRPAARQATQKTPSAPHDPRLRGAAPGGPTRRRRRRQQTRPPRRAQGAAPQRCAAPA